MTKADLIQDIQQARATLHRLKNVRPSYLQAADEKRYLQTLDGQLKKLESDTHRLGQAESEQERLL